MTKEESEIQLELSAFQNAEETGDAREACRYFGIGARSARVTSNASSMIRAGVMIWCASGPLT
jgi:hypothetical protein